MTMPASNINLITDVRNGFMQDTSGNASLNSAKYRDGAGKGTGNVALTDFAGAGWRQGRTLQAEGSASTVKPYMLHSGVDNLGYDSKNFEITISGGLPRWRVKRKWFNLNTVTSAVYANAWFRCYRPGVAHTLSWDSIINALHNGYNSYVSYEYTVRGWSNGYQSGTQTTIQGWTNVRSNNGPKSYTFTPSGSYPYIQVALRLISSGYQGWDGANPELDITAYNMKVTT